METHDDDLSKFETDGAAPLPDTNDQGYVEHAEYLARNIPKAELIELAGISHFAPLQRPEQFNSTMLAFLGKTLA